MNAPIHSYNLSKSLPTNIHNLSDLELGAHTALSSGSGAQAGAIYYNNFILILTMIARARRGSCNFITRRDDLTASTTSIRAIHDSGGIYNLLLHPHDERACTHATTSRPTSFLIRIQELGIHWQEQELGWRWPHQSTVQTTPQMLRSLARSLALTNLSINRFE
jgi:hypothetical protein